VAIQIRNRVLSPGLFAILTLLAGAADHWWQCGRGNIVLLVNDKQKDLWETQQ
jgi:hypothetical protein